MHLLLLLLILYFGMLSIYIYVFFLLTNYLQSLLIAPFRIAAADAGSRDKKTHHKYMIEIVSCGDFEGTF
jgi:hypothetical protein